MHKLWYKPNFGLLPVWPYCSVWCHFMINPNFPHVAKGDFINSGGFASVYRDPGNPDLYLKKLNSPLTGELAQMLERLIDIQQWARPSDRATLLTRFSWPVEGFGTNVNIEGFSMPKAPDDAYFSLTTAGRTSRQLLQMKFLMDKNYFNRKAVTSAKPNISEQDRLEIAIDLHDSIQTVHRHGLVYSDYSGNNLVVRLGNTPAIFILDADSIATPELREKHPIKSPTWDVPNGLDPLQSDRALFALWCWRFLIEEYSVYPSVNETHKFQSLQSRTLVNALIETYKSGSQHAFDSLSTELRNIRDDARDSLAIKRAYESGFARYVIRESAEIKSEIDGSTIALAENHLAKERLIEISMPSRQRILLSRETHTSPHFKLDLPPSITSYVAPQNLAEFEEMIRDARETEIALHFSTGSLSKFEDHHLLDRVLEHGLVEAGLASITSRTGIESAEVQWTWPVSPFTNYAQIQIKSSRRTITHEIARKKGKQIEDRKLNLPGGGDVQIEVITGVRSPSGKTVLAPEKLRHSISIPAAPFIPDLPRKRSALQQNIDDDASFFDIEEQRRQQEIAERIRRKEKMKRIYASCAAAIILPLSGLGYFWFSNDAEIEKCRNISLAKTGVCRYDRTGKISSADYFKFYNSEYLLVYSDNLIESVEG